MRPLARSISDLLDSVVAPQVIHHVAFGPEALAAVLRTVKGPLVIVQPHVNHQVVPIVEAFSAFGLSADELGFRKVVGHVSVKILSPAENLATVLIGTRENLARLHHGGRSAEGSPLPLLRHVLIVRTI